MGTHDTDTLRALGKYNLNRLSGLIPMKDLDHATASVLINHCMSIGYLFVKPEEIASLLQQSAAKTKKNEIPNIAIDPSERKFAAWPPIVMFV
jgi:hypothetical protein